MRKQPTCAMRRLQIFFASSASDRRPEFALPGILTWNSCLEFLPEFIAWISWSLRSSRSPQFLLHGISDCDHPNALTSCVTLLFVYHLRALHPVIVLLCTSLVCPLSPSSSAGSE